MVRSILWIVLFAYVVQQLVSMDLIAIVSALITAIASTELVNVILAGGDRNASEKAVLVWVLIVLITALVMQMNSSVSAEMVGLAMDAKFLTALDLIAMNVVSAMAVSIHLYAAIVLVVGWVLLASDLVLMVIKFLWTAKFARATLALQVLLVTLNAVPRALVVASLVTKVLTVLNWTAPMIALVMVLAHTTTIP